MKILSIVVPCYNEEKALALFYQEISKVTRELEKDKEMEVEYVLVDDGSTDGTLSVIHDLRQEDARVHYVSFSRNFGKEAALYAGLQHAQGDLVAVMDADLQDPPALLPQMVAGVLSGDVDCVATRRVTRKGEPRIRSWFARKFYRIINRISDVQLVDGARDYRVMTRRMVDALLSMPETNRFSKGLFAWVGFRTQWLEYENIERVAGETKWSFWKLFRYALEGIISFSTAPLAIASFAGIFFCVIALALALFYGIKAIAFGDPVAGFPTTVCLLLLIGGLQMLFMGILGQYLAKLYLEAKRRPVYIAREKG